MNILLTLMAEPHSQWS